MNIYKMSNNANLKMQGLCNKYEPVNLVYDYRCKYEFYKLERGQALAFSLLDNQASVVRSAASVYGLRQGAKFCCIKHGEWLEVARIK